MSSKINKSEEQKIDELLKDTVQEEPTKVGGGATAAPIGRVMSETDSSIAGITSDQQTLESKEALYTTTEMRPPNLLELPEECVKLHKTDYRFRWLAKDKNLEAKLRTSIWVLCTRESAPFMKKHRFKDHGAVEQAGMLLAFTTERLAKIREQQPAQRSKELVQHYTKGIHKNEAEGFYKPQSSADDSEQGLTVEV